MRAAGWYDDPEDPDQLRYHDGVQWTAEVLRRHQPSQVPVRPAVPAHRAASAPDPGSPPRGSGQYAAERPPSSWLRLAAGVIDALAVLLLASPVLAMAYRRLLQLYPGLLDPATSAEASRQMSQPGSAGQVWSGAMLIAIGGAAVLYETVTTRWLAATPGKLAVGLHVREGEAWPGWNACATRALVKGLPLLLAPVPVLGVIASLFGVLNLVAALRRPDRRALHDLIARTRPCAQVRPVRRNISGRR